MGHYLTAVLRTLWRMPEILTRMLNIEESHVATGSGVGVEELKCRLNLLANCLHFSFDQCKNLLEMLGNDSYVIFVYKRGEGRNLKN